MDVEVSIAERLQKLRQWQVEQQERLLTQQRIQREILSSEQDRICKVLGLPINSDVIEDTDDMYAMHEIGMDVKETMSDCETSILQCNVKNPNDVLKIIDKRTSTNADPIHKSFNEKQCDDSDCISTIVDKGRKSVKDYSSSALSQKKELSDSLIEGIMPLPSNDISDRCASIDDIPLPSPKKDFQTILEEKLKKELEIMPNTHADMKIKPKRPFLKKGQGLSRFKMSTNLYPLTITMKKNNMPLSSNRQRIDRNDKSKSSTVHKCAFPKILDNFPIANGKRQLNLKTVPLPKKKIVNKPVTPANRITCNVTSNRSKHLSEMNTSDCDSKAAKELEEVRIFELLEEKAENSSFCSTSSTVLAFLQQSTPFKVKNRLNQTSEDNSIVATKKQQGDEQTSEMLEQEAMIQQKAAHTENSKSTVQCQVERFELDKHSRINAATIDSYWDTITIDDIPEKRKGIQNCFISANRVLQSKEACTNDSENRDAIVTVLSNSDEERDITVNEHNLMHDREVDASHHVRFAEYNEYRTIDSIDMSDTASDSPLKDYFEQQSWNRSIDISESSDVKKKLPFNYEKQINDSPLKIVSIENTIGTPKQLSLLHDVTKRNKKDLYSYIMKTVHAPEEENALSYKDESPNDEACYDNECTPIIEEIVQTSDEEPIIEETVQTSDEERSILSSPLSSSSSLLSDIRKPSSAHERKKYVLRSEPEKVTEKIAKIYSNVGEIDYPSEERMNQTNTFETDLLKNRLLELEKEIDIFRKESSALLFQRRKLQEDETILRKQYAEKEKNFEENKRRVQNQLEEEKKRIVREKIAMENRIRDAQEKARQNKMERQKAQNLQEQLEELRDELNIKESRWNAAESRYKSELRVLRVEISRLKQEIAHLQNIKKTNVRNLRKSTGQVITKAINQINKRVVVTSSKETSMKTCQDLSNTSSDTSVHDNDNENEDRTRSKPIMKVVNVNDDDFGQIEGNETSINEVKYKQVEIDSQPKRNQKYPEGNIVEKKRHLYENLLKDATSDLVEDKISFHTKQDMSSDSQTIARQIQNSSVKSNNKSYFTNKDLGQPTTAYVTKNTEYYIDRSREANQDSENDVIIEKEKKTDRTLSPEKNISSTLHPSSFPNQNSKTSMDNVKQIQFPDGRIEYWYPNGNVKKIFPEQEVTKMIYYNGDVREIDKNRKVRYFYATTRTWHTTTPDGLEILEFPDGQVEKRMSDGTVEVLFPDGIVAQTFINGDKILTLPNGQKEIHTKAHKRREYPDGTVKLVYVDGTQETRYSNGRKRIKDKDGNLLMDSYDI